MPASTLHTRYGPARRFGNELFRCTQMKTADARGSMRRLGKSVLQSVFGCFQGHETRVALLHAIGIEAL